VRGGPPRAETCPTGGVPGVRFTPSLADGSPPGIDVRVERRHGALVVRVAGNLDITGLASALGCAEDLEAALEGLRTVGARR
jgi:hypothetical protein